MNHTLVALMLVAGLNGPVATASAAPRPEAQSVPRLHGIDRGRSGITPGLKTLLATQSPTMANSYAVLFVDDGVSAAYFYALDLARPQRPVVDSLHVYDVTDLPADEESMIRFLWTSDGTAVALLLDGHPQAVFDFANRRGYCRSGLPAPQLDWREHPHTWDDRALEPFRR